MATSSIASLFTYFASTKPPPPPPTVAAQPPQTLPSHLLLPTSTSSSSSDPNSRWAPLVLSNEVLPSPSCSSVVCPSLAYANSLFFRSAYNVQVIVADNEPEEKLLGRFRREVMRAGVIQECKRRRFFENKQDEKKRKSREAAKRNRRRRPQSRNGPQERQEISKSQKRDDDDDNWDLPVGDLP